MKNISDVPATATVPEKFFTFNRCIAILALVTLIIAVTAVAILKQRQLAGFSTLTGFSLTLIVIIGIKTNNIQEKAFKVFLVVVFLFAIRALCLALL